MRKTFLLFAYLLITSALAVKAQISKTAEADHTPVTKVDSSPTARSQRGTVLLQKKLGLNDAQKGKVYDILLAQAQKIDSLKSAKSDTEKPQREMPKVYFNDTRIRFKPIFDASFSKISAVLTANQKKTFEAWTRESFYFLDTQYSSK